MFFTILITIGTTWLPSRRLTDPDEVTAARELIDASGRGGSVTVKLGGATHCLWVSTNEGWRLTGEGDLWDA